ncbi:MAG: two-component system response regulator [Cycloclasticus sp.]|nr:MAG: two-component system response regulator [Cycloclasticus sp.]
MKIMLIDDSKTIRKSVELYMKESGYEIILATDGYEALCKISEHHPDLIFVDITMPRLDGYQTCALIKQNHRYKHIPVLMLSSKGGLFDKAKGRVVGADDYLTKPFTKEGLLETIGRFDQKQSLAAN